MYFSFNGRCVKTIKKRVPHLYQSNKSSGILHFSRSFCGLILVSGGGIKVVHFHGITLFFQDDVLVECLEVDRGQD